MFVDRRSYIYIIELIYIHIIFILICLLFVCVYVYLSVNGKAQQERGARNAGRLR